MINYSELPRKHGQRHQNKLKTSFQHQDKAQTCKLVKIILVTLLYVSMVAMDKYVCTTCLWPLKKGYMKVLLYSILNNLKQRF